MVTITKTNKGSFLVTLPKDYVEFLRWSGGTKILPEVYEDGIFLRRM